MKANQTRPQHKAGYHPVKDRADVLQIPATSSRLPTFARFTAKEEEAVEAILDRGLPLLRASGIKYRSMDLRMDLSAVHGRIPLRLRELADADEFNFAHDVSGIVGHLNRRTGDLEGFFVPRFAKPIPRSAGWEFAVDSEPRDWEADGSEGYES